MRNVLGAGLALACFTGLLAGAATVAATRAQAGESASRGQITTYQQLLTLVRTGVPEEVILDRLGTLFVLDARQVKELEDAGASQKLIKAVQRAQPQARRRPEGADKVTDFVIILDCSASMLEKTKDGLPKMDVAKKAVTDLIMSIPNGLRLSFIVYGHDKQLGCKGVKALRSLREIDASGKEELKSLISLLQPASKTPIALALKTAGQELKKHDSNSGIVLISDGKETCGGDPVAEAAWLASNLKVTFGIHTIGFAIDAEGRRQLDQIAKITGGTYNDANNSEELEEAMQETGRKVIEVAEAPQPMEEPDEVAAPVKPGTFLHDAPLVTAGEYKGTLPVWSVHYYRLAVRKGQEVRVIAKIKKGAYQQEFYNEQTFSTTIYNDRMGAVSREVLKVEGDPVTESTFRNMWTAEADGVAYVAVASQMCGHNNIFDKIPEKPPSSYVLRIKLDPESTEGGEVAGALPPPAQVKPGTSLDNAAPLTAPTLALTKLGLGDAVYYRFSGKKGDRLDIDLAVQKPNCLSWVPQNFATYTLTIYDDDQVQVAQDSFRVKIDPVDAHSAAFTTNVGLTGDVYVSLACQGGSASKWPGGVPKQGPVAILFTKPGAQSGETGGSQGAFSGAEASSR